MSRKYERALKIRVFKAKQLATLINLKKVLLEKYPAKADLVEEAINKLVVKVEALRVFTLSDYLSTVYRYAVIFPELLALVPSPEEIKKLLE